MSSCTGGSGEKRGGRTEARARAKSSCARERRRRDGLKTGWCGGAQRGRTRRVEGGARVCAKRRRTVEIAPQPRLYEDLGKDSACQELAPEDREVKPRLARLDSFPYFPASAARCPRPLLLSRFLRRFDLVVDRAARRRLVSRVAGATLASGAVVVIGPGRTHGVEVAAGSGSVGSVSELADTRRRR